MVYPDSVPPLSLYLDQNVYGQMLDENPDWAKSGVGQLLSKATSAGRAEVWVSPTHVIETVQTADEHRRRAIASAMLDLIEARRMWWGHEFQAIHEFCGFLKQIPPDKSPLKFGAYLENRQTTMRQIWLGALALVGVAGASKFEAAVESLRRIKVTSQYLHAQFATDPDAWIERMIEVVENWETTPDDPLAALETIPLEEMQKVIAAALSAPVRPSSRAMKRLERNRRKVAQAYGAFEIGALLGSTLTLPLEALLIFDLAVIREKLLSFERLEGLTLLSKESRDAEPGSLATKDILGAAIRAVAKVGLPVTTLSYEVVLRELQQRFNNKEIPTGGLVLDADHAAALVQFDVIFTADKVLAESLKTLARTIHGRAPCIVSNARQLADVLQL